MEASGTATLEASLARIYRPGSEIVVGAGFCVGGLLVTCTHCVLDTTSVKEDDLYKGFPVEIDYPFTTRSRSTVLLENWVPVGATPGDIAILRHQPPDYQTQNSPPLASSADTDGALFEAFGFPKEKKHGAWAYGRIGKKNASGWRQLYGSPGKGVSIMGGFSGAPVWGVLERAILGMIVSRFGDQGFMIGSEDIAVHLGKGVILDDGNSRDFEDGICSALVKLSRKTDDPDGVARYLELRIAKELDPTKRYWMYVTAGHLGGAAAHRISQRGLAETDRFARLGAQEASRLLGNL